jgi:hypothetical protein
LYFISLLLNKITGSSPAEFEEKKRDVKHMSIGGAGP